MAQSLPFDQRFVRKTAEGFNSVGVGVSLCSVCGIKDECDTLAGLTYIQRTRGVVARVVTCRDYHPVISFKDATGIDASFNTFRRGMGWARRVVPGQPVRLYSKADHRIVGAAVVIEAISGPLEDLLLSHAKSNHLMLGTDELSAPERLHKVLVQLYGKNYASLEEVFSVVRLEASKDGRDSQ